ncbi:MAG: LptF/LptG family permease [Ignavibacteria bacterium]|nr:LptF/LptG family permease [Ignavibacteria bacterium]
MLIYKHILKAHIGPFLFSFFTVTLLFVLQFLIRTIDQLVGKGLSLWVITQLITLNLAWIVTLAVPMAVLVSTIMAFGSLSANNEIMIMKANGIGLNRLIIPVLIVATIITYLLIRFNNDVLPEANHQARLLLGDISRTKPTFILESGKFSEDINGIKILAKKTFEHSNNLEGIYIFDYSDPTHKNLVTAEFGDIGFTSDFKNIVMNLTNGEIHQLDNRDYSGDYRKVKFTKHRLIFPAEGFTFQRTGDNAFMRGDRELSTKQMRVIIDSLKLNIANYYRNLSNELKLSINRLSSLEFRDTVINLKAPISAKDTIVMVYRQFMNVKKNIKNAQQYEKTVEDQIDMYLVEIYKKYSIPFACIVFILIGAPLGYRVKKGNFGIAAGLSLLFFLIYWAALIGGEKLADRGFITPFLGMWLVNIVLGIFGLYLMFKSA